MALIRNLSSRSSHVFTHGGQKNRRAGNRLAAYGGKYRPAQGVSTKSMRSALYDWFEQERQAAIGQADVAW